MPRKLNEESKLALADPTIPDVVKEAIRVTDNVAMSLAFPDSAEMERETDPDAAADFLVVGRELETKALNRYLKLKRTIGKQIADAEREYHEHRQRNLRLFNIVAGDLNAEGKTA